jgi:hypothetical protein
VRNRGWERREMRFWVEHAGKLRDKREEIGLCNGKEMRFEGKAGRTARVIRA